MIKELNMRKYNWLDIFHGVLTAMVGFVMGIYFLASAYEYSIIGIIIFLFGSGVLIGTGLQQSLQGLTSRKKRDKFVVNVQDLLLRIERHNHKNMLIEKDINEFRTESKGHFK